VTSRYAVEHLGVTTAVGIEIVPTEAEYAARVMDAVHVLDIEKEEIPYPDGYFGCILFADVLEHTVDPWDVLRRSRRLLSPDGVVIASIPNIGHITTVAKIIFDRFEYQDWGLLDRTHLRFFTRHTVRGLFRESGYEVLHMSRNYLSGIRFTALRLMTLGLMKNLHTYQHLVVARPLR